MEKQCNHIETKRCIVETINNNINKNNKYSTKPQKNMFQVLNRKLLYDVRISLESNLNLKSQFRLVFID